MLYAKSSGGFYDRTIHTTIPDDAVEITDADYNDLLTAQSQGAAIAADADGRPVAVWPPPKTLDEIKAGLCTRLDARADAARLKIAGDPLRAIEYQLAEQEAATYQAAGYTGAVGGAVQSWADAKGWTTQAAADDILAVAAAWNQALYALRDIRLKGKEAVRCATDEAAATTAADAVLAQIQAVLTGMGL